MNCDGARERLTDWLNDELTPKERQLVDDHLAGCSACVEELTNLQRVWKMLDTVPVPEPSEQVHINFYAMLDEYKRVEMPKSRRPLGWMDQIGQWAAQYGWRVAYSVALLLVGVGAGYWLNQRTDTTTKYEQQLGALSTQMHEMRQMMLLTLIENPSATERMKAVSMTNEIGQADGQIVDALLTTLNHDPNVNVRLVTLEALHSLAADPRVREGLVKAIAQQDSPLVLAAMVDVMVSLQEKRSVKPLRQWLKSKNLDRFVKGKIEKGIQVLT